MTKIQKTLTISRNTSSMLRKDVYGSYEPPHLYEIVKKNVAIGLYTAELLTWYNKEEWDKMNDLIDHDKDEQYKTLKEISTKSLRNFTSQELLASYISSQNRIFINSDTRFTI